MTRQVAEILIFNFAVIYDTKLVDGKFQHISESDIMLLEIDTEVSATQLDERCYFPLLLAH